MDNIGAYTAEEFPLSRIATIDIGQAGLKKHHIKALIELDVTEARRLIREKRQQSEKISFNAWLIKCISEAVANQRQLQAIRQGRRKLVLFEDVDISIVIEREIDGQKVPLPYVIRRANEKSIAAIGEEIRSGQHQAIEGEDDYVLGERPNRLAMKMYYWLPGFIRRLVWKRIVGSPFLTKANMGTVMVTSVGMVGRINGWVIPVSVHPLCFAVGSIIKKPGVVKDRVEIREYLHVTVLVDHDVIDGAPAVRALSKLVRMVESGYGLQEKASD